MSFLNFDRKQWTWLVFDCGTFGFSTLTLSTLLPVLFKQIYEHGNLSSSTDVVSAWGYCSSFAALIGCFCSPFLGAVADAYSWRKRCIVGSVLLAITGVTCLAFSDAMSVGWVVFLGFVSAVTCGYYFAVNMYNAMMPFCFEPESLHTASCISCGLSNVGAAVTSSILLAVTVNGNSDAIQPSTVTLLLCFSAGWLAFFVLLFLLSVPEPQASSTDAYRTQHPLARICDTLRCPPCWG